MADPYDYTGRDGRGNDKLWHEEDEDMDEECMSYDDRDELDKPPPYWPEGDDEPEYDDMMSTYDDQFELED
jgi:hypothetical protein